MVEHGWIAEADFEKFTFTNPVRFYTGTNPDFFKGRGSSRPSIGCSPETDVFDLVLRGGTVVDGTGTAPVVADVGIRNGRIVGRRTRRRTGPDDARRERQGGLPRLRRYPHPLRRPAPVGSDGQSFGPPRCDHGAGRELRVLDRPAPGRRRRVHPANDGGGRGDPAGGAGGRGRLGVDVVRRSTWTASTSAWPSMPVSWSAIRRSGGR